MGKNLDLPENILQATGMDDALLKITGQPKRQYTQEEIDEARGNLALMNDRVFLATFVDNKNHHIITGLTNAARKIHALVPIPAIERTAVQNISLFDVLGRGMIGDLFGEGECINVTVEAQKDSQAEYAVRGTLTSSNAMRVGWNAGKDYADAPDVIGINILGFRLQQLEHNKMFCTRIVRADYDNKVPFLADKYSDYYIELPKMDEWTKENLPEEYHDLWDICCIFKAKVKEHKEVIRMQAISNSVALDLSGEVRRIVAPSEFVNGSLDQKGELEQLRNYILWREKKMAQKVAQEATKKAEDATAEKMIISAFQNNFPVVAIETMQKTAGLTDARLAELKKQALAI